MDQGGGQIPSTPQLSGNGYGQQPVPPLQYPVNTAGQPIQQPGSFDMIPGGQQVTAQQPVYQNPVQQPAMPGMAAEEIRPDWQRDLQYSVASNNAPQVGYQAQQVNLPAQYATGFESLGHTGVASSLAPETYSLLTEPIIDSPKSSGGGGAKKPLFVIGVILITLLLIGGAAALGYRVGHQKGVDSISSKQEKTLSSTDKTQQEEEPAQTEEPELSFELIQPDFAEESLTGSLGEQLNASDGLVVNAYNVDSEYTIESADPSSEGSTFVKIDLVLGNADSARPKTITTSAFKLVDDQGELIEPLDAVSDGLGSTGSVTLSPGMKARMSVVFSLSTPNSSMQIVRSQVYQVGSEARTVAMQISLDNSSSDTQASPSRLEE